MEVRLRGRKNVFEEIASEYERLIRLGALGEGEKLPSVRALAMQLGVNPNTVERAYMLLERRGLITMLPKKGAFVRGGRGSALEEEARSHVAALKEAGVTRDQLLAVVQEIYGKGEEND